MLTQVALNGLVTGIIYVMMALGFSITYSSMGFFNMAHGATYLTGAYLTYLFVRMAHFPMVPGMIAGIVLATLVHVGIGQAVYMPMRRRGSAMWIVAIAAIGVSVVFQAVVGMTFGTAPISVRPGYIPTVYQFWGVRLTAADTAVFVVALVAVAAYTVLLRRTKIGLATRGAVADAEMAQVVGVRTARVDGIVFAVASLLAAVAGSLMTLESALTHTMGGPALLKAIVASILGIGWGIPGALVGGLFLGIAENFTVSLLGAGWRNGISLLVLILFVWAGALVRRWRR
jgi:branched-chain amino acid transport system permease protein